MDKRSPPFFRARMSSAPVATPRLPRRGSSIRLSSFSAPLSFFSFPPSPRNAGRLPFLHGGQQSHQTSRTLPPDGSFPFLAYPGADPSFLRCGWPFSARHRSRCTVHRAPVPFRNTRRAALHAAAGTPRAGLLPSSVFNTEEAPAFSLFLALPRELNGGRGLADVPPPSPFFFPRALPH